MRFNQVVSEKSKDDGGVCDAVVSRKCRSSGFGWVVYMSMGKAEDFTSDGVGNVIPAKKVAHCID